MVLRLVRQRKSGALGKDGVWHNLRRLPPSDDNPAAESKRRERHDCSGVILAMRKVLTSLVQRLRSPMRSGFAELDLQIEKLRTLRDSYQATFTERKHFQTTDLTKKGECWCTQ